MKPDTFPIMKHVYERRELEHVLIDLLNVVSRNYEVTCMAVICDEVYLNVFSGSMFRSLAPIPFVMVGIKLYSHLPRPIIYELFLDISKSANVCVNLLVQER